MSTSSNVSARFLTASYVAAMLGMSSITLRNWTTRGKIGYLKIGGRIMFDPEVVERFIQDSTRPAKSDQELA
jgi:excisionase family DNA binding protein